MSQEQPKNRKVRVAVLMGGTSSERPVSLSTGKMILNTLDPERYDAIAIDTQDIRALSVHAPAHLPAGPSGQIEKTSNEAENSAAMLTTAKTSLPNRDGDGGRPDVVFIALHGKGGEDGTIQGMLELLGLPYTGSGVLASALAMNKTMTKRLLRTAPIPIPVIDEITIPRGHNRSDEDLIHTVRECFGEFPVFVKPNAEGSTFGCTLVTAPEELPQAVAKALEYDPIALIEKYVRGMEITVGVLGNAGEELEALPVIEIVPKSAFYDYESKYADGGSEHIIPARLSPQQTALAQIYAKQCHQLLGCRGMSRTDMIVADDKLYVLEVNTIPGMTPTSLLPQAAEHAGISFSELLDRLIQSALK